MVQITGSYKLEKNEKLDEFYTAAGVPWVARKVMLTTSPTMHITKEKDENEDDTWLFKTVTFIRTVEQSFKLNEPFEETMPSGDCFNSVATMEGDNKFILKSTSSISTDDDDDTAVEEKKELEREYLFTEDMLTITLKHPSGIEAKRYFKRI